jgi:hypothetical protein
VWGDGPEEEEGEGGETLREQLHKAKAEQDRLKDSEWVLGGTMRCDAVWCIVCGTVLCIVASRG